MWIAVVVAIVLGGAGGARVESPLLPGAIEFAAARTKAPTLVACAARELTVGVAIPVKARSPLVTAVTPQLPWPLPQWAESASETFASRVGFAAGERVRRRELRI